MPLPLWRSSSSKLAVHGSAIGYRKKLTGVDHGRYRLPYGKLRRSIGCVFPEGKRADRRLAPPMHRMTTNLRGLEHMATHTRPYLMTGAALVSAAAVVMATPTIAPGITGSPLSISSARYDLATFADLLSVTPTDWVNAYFQGWGGAVGANNPPPGPLEPWASACDEIGGCYVQGLSGLAYLALDALIDGNGNGYEDSGNWTVGAVNYFFEGGFSAGAEYLAQSAFGQANPLLATLITIAFAGPSILSVIYTDALGLVAGALNQIPVVGSVLAGGVYAYLGYNPDTDTYYTPGLSGLLNYVVDLFAGLLPTGSAVTPPAAARVAALAAASSPAPAEARTEASGQSIESEADSSADSDSAEADDDSAHEVKAETPESTSDETSDESADDTTADDTTAEDTTAEDTTAEETSSPSQPVQTPAGAVADTVTGAPAPTAPQGAPVKARKHPVRDALQKVTASIGSALKSAAAKRASAGSAG